MMMAVYVGIENMTKLAMAAVIRIIKVAGCKLVVVEEYGFVDVAFFFFQAEDGIRDHCVTGVQTCALPICTTASERESPRQPIEPSTMLGTASSSPSRDDDLETEAAGVPRRRRGPAIALGLGDRKSVV